MPNLLLHTRPFATIGNAASLNHMYADTRNRETRMVNISPQIPSIYGGKRWFVTIAKKYFYLKGGEMSWFFLACWQLVSHNVLMLASIEKLLVNIFKKTLSVVTVFESP